MILNMDDEFLVDVEKISVLRPIERLVAFNGPFVSITEEQMKILVKAFKWQHNSHTYDKNFKLKK